MVVIDVVSVAEYVIVFDGAWKCKKRSNIYVAEQVNLMWILPAWFVGRNHGPEDCERKVGGYAISHFISRS